MKIGLIVGHEKDAQGAQNKDLGTTEYMFNRRLVQRLANRIEEDSNHECVVIYRLNGYSQLPSDVNEKEVDIAISFHCNSVGNTEISGNEVLYYWNSKKGKAIAKILNDAIFSVMRERDRGIKAIDYSTMPGKNDAGGWLVEKTAMPCVIIEPFFISNTRSLTKACDNKKELITALSSAIIECCEVI